MGLAVQLKIQLKTVHKLVEVFRGESFRDSNPTHRKLHAFLRIDRIFDEAE